MTALLLVGLVGVTIFFYSRSASSLEQIHKLVNAQKTALLAEISVLKDRISRMLPDDEDARKEAREARADINDRVVTDAMLHQAVQPFRKKDQ
jgi:hypothetical protein